jgi:uncharacterized membrane protein (DUF2068 family)
MSKPRGPGQRRERADKAVVLIGVFKLVKALLLVGVGLGSLLGLPQRISQLSTEGARWTAMVGGREVIQRALAKVLSLDDKILRRIGVASLCYALIFVVEGVGLIRKKRWAEWLTVIVTASFIPFEIYELARHFTGAKVAALVLNVLIAGYLLWRRWPRERHSRPNAQVSMAGR